MKHCKIVFDDELYHYGVKGMKWGVRHDYVPKGRRSTTSKVKKKWNGLSDKQKRAIKIGAGISVSVLAVGGGVYLYKTGKFSKLKNKGEAAIKGQLGRGFESLKVNKKQLGKSFKDSDKPFVKTINAANVGTPGGKGNCFHTSLAYITNSLFGKSCSALPYDGIDETSGAFLGGRHVDLYDAIFSGINRQRIADGTKLGQNLDKIPKGSTGILFITNNAGEGHFFNYERTTKGALTFIDTQPENGWIMDGKTSPFNQFYLEDILDFSNAKFKKGSGKILDYIIK